MKWTEATAWAIEQLLDRDAEQETHQAAISLLMKMARRLEGNAQAAREALEQITSEEGQGQ